MNAQANLYAVELEGVAWRKSSYTANNGNCVEAARLPAVSGIAIRDSKNVDIPAARVSHAAWSLFLGAVADGSITER
jgi:hypothetical protein